MTKGCSGTDSPVMAVFNTLMNLVVLNICFLISCIPFVTVGAAITALYSVNLKMVKGEEGYVFRGYWEGFVQNFRQGTVCWLFMIGAALIFALDLRTARLFSGIVNQLFLAGAYAVGIVVLVVFLYVFPYMARFQDGVGVCLKNALIIGGSRFGYTFALLFITVAAVAASVYNPQMMAKAFFVWFTAGFAALNYVKSYFFRNVFSVYENAKKYK